MTIPCPPIPQSALDSAAEIALNILEVEGKLHFTGDRNGDTVKVVFFNSLDERAVDAVSKVVNTTREVFVKVQEIAKERGERVTTDSQMVYHTANYGHETHTSDVTLYLHRN